MSLHVDIKKTLGDFKLDMKFSAKAEIMSILGASGCGKSMTLKCIAGIEEPDEGKIILGDRVLFDSANKINLSPQQRRVGYLFQNYALFPNMTVEENIASGVKQSKSIKMKKVQEMIEMFLLQGLEKKRPAQLSGGQQQRVALARILASEPEIIMLDEPFSALDSYLKWQLEQELMDLLSTYKGTVLLVSHNRNEVYRLSETIAVVSDGRVDAVSGKEDLFENPRTMSAALLTGCKNVSAAKKIDDHHLNAVNWGMILYTSRIVPDDIKHVGMRAHYFTCTESNDLPNTMNCEIVKVIENPFSFIVILINKNGNSHQELYKIRWELDKDVWKNISQRSSAIRLVFNEESLLLLR